MGRKRLTTEEVKGRIEDLTGNEYLLLGNYANAKTKMLVKHILCQNEYKVTWKAFHQGNRCPKCSGKEKLNNEEIDKRIHELTRDKYVRIGEYIDSSTKILIKHNLCQNTYEVRWNSFQQGARCPKCFGVKKLSNEEIDKVMFELVGGEYIRISRYLNATTKISIKHNVCGYIYDVKWNDFHQGSRCPKCNESKGEKKISDILNSLGIKYTSQKRFPECKYKNTLSFDFYVSNKKSKLLIEFDGKQHFESVDIFGGDNGLRVTQLRDKIKNDFAKEKDIPLLRIPYTEQDNIESILTNKLKELDFI